jgi:RTX calcium-binding nonapeptide repeat (4 copies)
MRSRSRIRLARAAACVGLLVLALAQTALPHAIGAESTPGCLGHPATIVGTPDADRLTGTAGPDVIVALAGDDRVFAEGDDDVVCAGPGRDVVEAGSGGDSVSGGPGGDSLWGGDADDSIFGGDGTDTCFQDGGAGSLASCERPPSVACPQDPVRGVYRPTRLSIVDECRWYQGHVVKVEVEADGDHHLAVEPDPGYGQFLTDPNRALQGGHMVVEIVKGQRLDAPEPGEHVAVFGTLVADTHGDRTKANDWREIHPVWAIRYMSRGMLVVKLPPKHPKFGG